MNTISNFDLLKKFCRGEVLSDEQLKRLESILHSFEKYTTKNSYFGSLPDFDIELIKHGASMYLYSVRQIIEARKIKG